MKPITLYTANLRGDASNSVYPTRRVITAEEEMKEAAQYDQVFAEYRNNRRSVDNFICSDCLPFDCGNDHSDLDSDWKTAADVEAAFRSSWSTVATI